MMYSYSNFSRNPIGFNSCDKDNPDFVGMSARTINITKNDWMIHFLTYYTFTELLMNPGVNVHILLACVE